MLELPTREAATQPRTLELRAASVEDASDIYALSSAVFGNLQFLYTIYQAPQSVRHIARLIESNDPSHPFVVASEDGKLVGFYEALVGPEQAFLSYIATEPDAQGRGVGSLLLQHLERSGREAGSQRLALDVFRSNLKAVRWYERLGFKLQSQTQVARISLQKTTVCEAPSISFSAEEFALAQSEEKQWGFSRVACTCGEGSLSLGIIGGHTCKLLHFSGISLADAISAIAARFRSERNFLIFSFEGESPSIARAATPETVLRLSRTLK